MRHQRAYTLKKGKTSRKSITFSGKSSFSSVENSGEGESSHPVRSVKSCKKICRKKGRDAGTILASAAGQSPPEGDVAMFCLHTTGKAALKRLIRQRQARRKSSMATENNGMKQAERITTKTECRSATSHHARTENRYDRPPSSVVQYHCGIRCSAA